MITVANRIYVAPEYQDEFEERFRNRARLVDGMPGFISNQVHTSYDILASTTIAYLLCPQPRI